MPQTVALALVTAISTGLALGLSCYAPNGEDRNAQFNVSNLYFYAPCDPTAAHSMCCGWGAGRIEIGNEDTCRSDGLCQSDTDIWRESCTDPTWQAPECLKLFMNGTGYQDTEEVILDSGLPLADIRVRKCDDGSWCYGSGNEACCAQGEGVWLNSDGEQVDTEPDSISITPTSSVTSLTNTSATAKSSTAATTTTTGGIPVTTSSAASDGGLSNGAQAGVGVGVGGAALLALVAFGCWIRKRRRSGAIKKLDSTMIHEAPTQPRYAKEPVEVEGNQSLHELDSSISIGHKIDKHPYVSTQ